MNCCFIPSAFRVSGPAQNVRGGSWFRCLAALVLLGHVLLAAAAANAADTQAAGPLASASKPHTRTSPPPTGSDAADTGGNTNAGPATAPASAAPAATNEVNVLDDQYALSIGDHLSYRVVEDEDNPQSIVVTDSGDVEVPYLGRYPAVGKTCKELAQQLKAALEKTYYIHATVIIAVDSKPKSRGKVYLVGAIGAPGAEDIPSDEILTVGKAILRAGGLTSFADGSNVKVTRGDTTHPGANKSFTVNVLDIFEKGRTSEDVALQPGDLIFVPERMIRF
jgi:polysaccharide export outer membrane protein